ncbi:YihY/virulence factor BrkB family protein [Carnobacterium maltaromaticum]|uniref:YihY/virulence factor BrkB family protein n=1 Tax=Carnobacterium maltaromaticum TaxID=2751 RepID=UPI0012F9B888|nr:YihY/virulence factor BrkB family protein [Carnobacterium maltaromaticum]
MENNVLSKKPPSLKEEIKNVLVKVNLSANAAQLSFYILLSLFPMLLVGANLIVLSPLTTESIGGITQTVIPPEVLSLLNPIFESLLDSSSGVTISFGLITAIWSASRCFSTVQVVLNSMYNTNKRRNFIIARIFSFIVTLALITLFGILVFLFAFGEKLIRGLGNFLSVDLLILNFLSSSDFVTLLFLFTLFLALFYFIPNVRWNIKYSLPGAVFSTFGILCANQLLKLYVQLFGDSFLGLGSLSLFIVLMLWLYLIMIIFLLGALVNVVYHNYVTNKK